MIEKEFTVKLISKLIELTTQNRIIWTTLPKYLYKIFCENPQNLVKQRITPHFLIIGTPNYYEFTTKG